MKVVQSICGPFDEDRYKRLKKAYDQAVAEGKDQFYFESQPMLTAFAKYVVEWLDWPEHFGGQK